MPDLPPLLRDQRKTDADHLRLLAIFHFVFAGLAIVGLGFLGLHYAIMNTVISNPDLWANQKEPGPRPDQFFMIFRWFYVFAGVFLIAGGIGNLMSGLFIRGKRHRLFSLVVAGLNCLQFPFGTLLGVFTFVVLLRDSVREVYDAGGYRTNPGTDPI